jgi:aryl-phospho-beta-D-glucosidase BglC (GH1 family)
MILILEVIITILASTLEYVWKAFSKKRKDTIAKDFKIIKDAGLNSVRIFINMTTLEKQMLTTPN